MRYIILFACTFNELEEKVNDKIDEGYYCQEGVAVSEDEENIGFYQAMLCEDDINEDEGDEKIYSPI